MSSEARLTSIESLSISRSPFSILCRISSISITALLNENSFLAISIDFKICIFPCLPDILSNLGVLFLRPYVFSSLSFFSPILPFSHSPFICYSQSLCFVRLRYIAGYQLYHHY